MPSVFPLQFEANGSSLINGMTPSKEKNRKILMQPYLLTILDNILCLVYMDTRLIIIIIIICYIYIALV